jgi:hypothetical protein
MHDKLSWLEQWLKADSLDLNFDWLKLYMTCATIWYFAAARLEAHPHIHNRHLLPNDPGRHEAIALQVLDDTIEGNGSSISVMALSIGEVITMSNPAP